jgi:Protein of unknown function (DUF3306)
MAAEQDKGFLGRWSARKVAVKEGKPVAEPVVMPTPTVIPAQAGIQSSLSNLLDSRLRGNDGGVLALTLEDVTALTPASDFSGFVAKGVDTAVKNAAMKKLFTDPHYNIMDGLDIYIGDYSTHAVLPQSVIDEITKDGFLNMFQKDEVPAESPPPAEITTTENIEKIDHDDPDLQLQRDNAARREGAGSGAVKPSEAAAGLEAAQLTVPPPSA